MKILNLIFITYLLFIINSHAEITLDGTLGSQLSLTGPNYAITENLGQLRGSNLFHSFGEFNINIGESATFSGSDNINNVISRITGGNLSTINGLLSSTIPNADVYLINPAGMIFGTEAALDVQGAFHASTADTLHFSDGSEFNASNPAKSLLTIAPITAFGFLTNSPQALTINSSSMSNHAQTLSFIGGAINIQDAVLQASPGRINLVSLASNGEVAIQNDDLVVSAQAGEIKLQDSMVNVNNGGTGIYIRAGKLLLDNSNLTVNTSDLTDAGKIDILANDLVVTNGSQIKSNALASKNAGTININVINTSLFTGDKMFEDNLTISGIITSSKGSGNAGRIILKTDKLYLENGATINGVNYGTGLGGQIDIEVNHEIKLFGVGSASQGSSITANTRGKMVNAGDSGTINLVAGNLSLFDGAQIGSNSFGSGNGGQINLAVANNINLAGEDGRIISDTPITSSISTISASSGNSGNIFIKAKDLNVFQGSSINATTGGTGSGGEIRINVSDTMLLKGNNSFGYGNFIKAQTVGEMNDSGDGGSVEITTKNLQLLDGSQIGTSSFSTGNSGTVHITVTKTANIAGQEPIEEPYASGIFTTSEGQTSNAGSGGTIVFTAENLNLADYAEINAATYGPGQGGNILLKLNGITTLSNNGIITALSEATGNAGQIELVLGDKLIIRNAIIETRAEMADGGNLVVNSPSYIYLINGKITTSVSEEFGGGGNITLSPEFIILDDAQIFAKAKRGKGGNINITTTGIYNFTSEPIENIISASSEFGTDGIVVIDTPDSDADEGLFNLPTVFFDASRFRNTPCSEKVAENISQFTVAKSEGANMSPTDFLASNPILFKRIPVADNGKNKPIKYVKVAQFTGCNSNLTKK
ncbi:MAG: filamentous hemagglutinin N-terminal domain-containing protein [Thiomargarita sp.]|nr:filamentous hemagglutinin N-terminal domain-containing protein [Thiomargarita sp.]